MVKGPYDISHFQCSLESLWLTRGDALRSAQRLPLAILCSAFGACPWLFYVAPSALAPGYSM